MHIVLFSAPASNAHIFQIDTTLQFQIKGGGRLLIFRFLEQKIPNFHVQNGIFERNYPLINKINALVDVTDA